MQNFDENQKAVATVKVTPTFVCNSVTLNESPVVSSQPVLKPVSDSELPGTSTGEVAAEEKITKKVTRNTSNGSKRKVRLRRMGSRQSSKTESDSEDEQAVSTDVARKTKRKTSRAKKQLESDKSFDSFQGDDEVVYIFKIKPGEKNEMMVKASDIGKSGVDESIIIPTTEASVQLIESNTPNGSCQNLLTSAIVKTKRKIFTPVNVHDGEVTTTISQEIESSSASDKNDSELQSGQQLSPQPESENIAKVSSLPPLPSPKVQKKFELTKQNSGKDLSPSIRLMIDRYNFNFDKKSNSPNSSGSCSPIWRSPILDRRVRKQSAEYQHMILKSNSFQDVVEVEKKEENEVENVQVKDLKEQKVEQSNESSTETLIESEKPKSLGAIPKELKIVEPIVPVPSPVPSFSDSVTLRSDVNKPRTPLTERAMKIKQAKEAFLRMPLISNDSSHSDWSCRLSQISVGSTDSNADAGSLIKCLSAGVLVEVNNEKDETVSIETKSSSLPRSVQGLNTDPETVSESSRSSKFGLSSIATKLRKVKLKRNAKEVKKMNTVPVLCRQSLAVDFTPSAALNNNNHNEEAALSESTQGSSSRFRKDKLEKIKKSKSLGIL